MREHFRGVTLGGDHLPMVVALVLTVADTPPGKELASARVRCRSCVATRLNGAYVARLSDGARV